MIHGRFAVALQIGEALALSCTTVLVRRIQRQMLHRRARRIVDGFSGNLDHAGLGDDSKFDVMSIGAAELGNERLLGAAVAFAKRMHEVELAEDLAGALRELFGRRSGQHVGVANGLQGLIEPPVDARAMEKFGFPLRHVADRIDTPAVNDRPFVPRVARPLVDVLKNVMMDRLQVLGIESSCGTVALANLSNAKGRLAIFDGAQLAMGAKIEPVAQHVRPIRVVRHVRIAVGILLGFGGHGRAMKKKTACWCRRPCGMESRRR